MLKNILVHEIEKYKVVEDDGSETWLIETDKEYSVDEEYYNNVVDAKEFFESLGGKEYHTKEACWCGAMTTCVESISPSGDTIHIWEFDFKDAEYKTEEEDEK